MADQDQTQNNTPTPAPTTPAVETPPAPQTITQKDIEGKTPEEIVKLVADISKESGASGEKIKQLEDYRKETQAVIDFLVGDPEAMNAVNEIWKKKNEPQSQTTPQPVPEKDDTRKTLENQIFSTFEREKGFDRLDPEKKKELATRVGQELMEMRDPGGKKNYAQVLADIPLDQLTTVLNKAYILATTDERVNRAKEEGAEEFQTGYTGVISSMPSSSSSGDEVTLTSRERQIADKQGISPEVYLQRKKEILERSNRG